MTKKRPKPQPEARRPKHVTDGRRATQPDGSCLITHTIGAMPILNQILKRMKLKEILQRRLPDEDQRTKVDTPRVVLLLLKNLLITREPMYGVAEWASNYPPELFDLSSTQLQHLNDDRVGRALDRIFESLDSSVIMDVVSHVVAEFDVRMDELHNDSTTVTFHGDYADAAKQQQIKGVQTPAITWGHNKDHRPDLKQLLYILTVADDGGVPIYFQTESGNVTDDSTHQRTWKLLNELVKRPDFVYVADCKLATTSNMLEIARCGGRFITILPATRKEDAEFRKRLVDDPECVTWNEVLRVYHEDDSLRDVYRVDATQHLSKEGFRLLWFHSQSKAETDAQTRARRVRRAVDDLRQLQERLRSVRTRFKTRQKVSDAVKAILGSRGVSDFLSVEIKEIEHETFRQATPGRPTKRTKYNRQVDTRFDIDWHFDSSALERASGDDGVFPIITNLVDWTPVEILQAYKRQPIIEKRFSHLKTDFQVAPVYLQSVSRIVGLLAVYFFALMTQSLLERELRLAMRSEEIAAIPLYPEGRPCTRPTTRQVIDVFDLVNRHTLADPNRDTVQIFTTELAPIHQQILKLLGIAPEAYRT